MSRSGWSHGWLTILATGVLVGAASFGWAQAGGSASGNSGTGKAQDVPPAVDRTSGPHDSSVSIKAAGTDIHVVLKDLFSQAKKNYVLEPGIFFSLYLSLDNVDFDEALGIVCHLAKLRFEVRDGIYFVKPDHKESTPAKPVPTTGVPVAAATDSKPAPAPSAPKAAPVSPSLTKESLSRRRVTVRFAKTEIRKVFAELGRQSKLTIAVDASVPAYKLDVVLLRTSLRYALDRITQAAGLTYSLDKGQVLIAKPMPKLAMVAH